MHGIERLRKIQGPPAPYRGVRQVQLRYHDGRVVTFVPDAGREFFSEDDMLELKKVLDRTAAAAEWAEITAQE